MKCWPSKDPDEVLDYDFDWSDRLESGETIVTSTWILESGDVVLGAEEVAGTLTKVWLSGGTHGLKSVLTNRVTTSEGRTYDQSGTVPLRNLC